VSGDVAEAGSSNAGRTASALQLLHEYSAPPSPVEFAERLRRYYAGGPEVRTGCTRVPNLCAIVLRELGYL
jgi:hypothetical protein